MRFDRLALAALVTLALVSLPMVAADRITGRAFATRSEVIAPRAMAATSQPLATQVALEVLRQGGNAVDAAIAANATLGLVEPTGCGIGGDLFAILWHAETGQLYGLNGSGRSPRALTLDHFRQQGLKEVPSHGPLPVTVPGAVDGWFSLHERFGKMPMNEVLAPAIRYAREGFPLSELIAYYWQRSVPILEPWSGFREVFMPGGRAPAKGEIFRNPALASTYQKLADEGRDVFYEGELARTMDAFMKREGGFLRYEDLAAHSSTWVEPLSTSYRGYELWELPPNGQGIAALQILNILEGYDIAAMGFGSPDYVHHFLEAKKLAFEDRARWIGDPQFCDSPVEKLISKAYAEERRKLIDPQKAADRYVAGDPRLDEGDTVYLTVGDPEGNMVSLIQSNYRGMGTGLSPDGLGFIFQDRGELFTLEEGHCNTYEPGKRPFHTIIPAFLTRDGKPIMSFGVMGGGTQPQAHAQIVMNMVDFGMNLQEAGDAPRILHTGSSEPTGSIMTRGGRVFLESGMGWETLRELLRRGHDVGWNMGSFGGYQAVYRDLETGVYFGASESRKDGQAAGF